MWRWCNWRRSRWWDSTWNYEPFKGRFVKHLNFLLEEISLLPAMTFSVFRRHFLSVFRFFSQPWLSASHSSPFALFSLIFAHVIEAKPKKLLSTTSWKTSFFGSPSTCWAWPVRWGEEKRWGREKVARSTFARLNLHMGKKMKQTSEWERKKEGEIRRRFKKQYDLHVKQQ